MAARARDSTLVLLACALLIGVAVLHARLLVLLGGFGMSAEDVALFAVVVFLLAGGSALLHRAQRQPLPARATWALGAGVLVLLVVVVGAWRSDDAVYGYSTGGFSGAYSSTLLLDFSPELPWGTAVVVVAALGLLPVAAAAAWVGHLRRIPLSRRLRVPLLLVAVAAGVVLLVHLERSVALLDLARGDSQQLAALDALVWVALLWSLAAVAASAVAVRRSEAGLLAVLVPLVVLVAWGLLLVDGRPRHACCFAYAPVDGSPLAYQPPPLLPDLLLLGLCLLIGLVLPTVLQLRRSRTSASTPPG